MASSTEHFDELFEWQPGAADAGRGNVLAAFAWGVRRSGRAKLLLVLLWLLYVALELGGGDALFALLLDPDFASEAFRRFILRAGGGGMLGLSAAQASYSAAMFTAPSRALWTPNAYFVVFYGLIAGGAISYLHNPRPAPFFAQFGAGCGTYAGRFFRLLLIQGGLFWLLVAVVDVVPFAGPGDTLLWFKVSATVAAVTLVAAIFDYARVRTVARDSHSMLIELARSARFFVRNLPRTLTLELVFLVATVAVANLAFLLHAGLGAVVMESTASALASQLLVLALLWLRLVAWGAMLSLYQGITLERLQQRS